MAQSALTQQASTQQVLPLWLGGSLAITQQARPWEKEKMSGFGQTQQVMPSELGGRNAITQQAWPWVGRVAQGALTQRAWTQQVLPFVTG